MNTYKIIVNRYNHAGGFERIEEINGFANACERAREIIAQHLNYSEQTGRKVYEVLDKLNAKTRMIGVTNWDGGCYVWIASPNDYRVKGRDLNVYRLIK